MIMYFEKSIVQKKNMKAILLIIEKFYRNTHTHRKRERKFTLHREI